MGNVKRSMVFNIIITIFVIIAVIMMLTGFKFMRVMLVLSGTKLSVFKFFTVLSNIFVGIVSLIMVYYEKRYLKSKKKIPHTIYLFKYMATASVFLTFFVTAFFLAPSSSYSYLAFFSNSNLFLHLVIPILSIFSFVMCEKNDLQFRETFTALIPMFLYGIYYSGNILIHLDEGISSKYDWYGFLREDISSIYIVVPTMIILTYLLGYLLWIGNKKLFNS